MRPSRLYRFSLLLITVLLLCLNGPVAKKVNEIRDKEEFSAHLALEGVPPEIAFATTALGAFRGIIVDILWLRATDLKEKGEYFELVQLSDWIGILEPRLEKVWAFNGWNLAYNISVELPTPPERWNWVQQGIRVLRDKGIVYNPRSASLYRELAWIYYHKVGGYTDDHNRYYKLRLADDMNRLMGGFSAREIKRGIAGEAAAESVTGDESEVAETGSATATEGAAEMTQAQWRVMADGLKSEYRLDVEIMAGLEDKYGPFDWRFPDSQAIYWLEQGRPFAADSEVMNFERIIYASLQNIMRRGKIHILSDDNGRSIDFYTTPNFPFTDKVVEKFDSLLAEGKRSIGVVSAYRYFLEELISLHYSYSHEEGAMKLFKKLGEVFPSDEKYKQPFKRAVLAMFTESVKESNQDEMANYILGLYTNAYYNFAIGNSEQGGGLLGIAENFEKFFRREFQSGGTGLADIREIKKMGAWQAHRNLARLGPRYQRNLEALVPRFFAQ